MFTDHGLDHDPAHRVASTLRHLGDTRVRTHSNGAVHHGGAAPRVGHFSFWFVDNRWEWSDDMFRMHGHAPGSVEPTTELVASHRHPDDRKDVRDLLDQARYSGGPFSGRHLICDTAGRERSVIVVADRMLDGTDAVVGATGYYIDVTETLAEHGREALDKALPKVIQTRAAIEQAKGALRLAYGINDEQAFTLLQWRSQENNTKLRALATQLVSELDTLTSVTTALRTELDQLIFTVHERVSTEHDSEVM